MPLSPADVAADERLRLLHTAIAEMFASLDLDHRIRTMATAARHLQTAEASAVLLRDDDEDALVIRAHEGLSDDYAKRQRIPMAAAQASYPGPDSHIVVDLRHRPRGNPALIRKEGLASVLSVPLTFAGSLIGALHVYTRDPARAFGEEDIEVAHILAGAAAIGVTNSRLYADAVKQQEILRAAEKEREQFVSIVSHELRTPLTPMKAMAQLLRARLRRHRTEGVELDLESLDRNLATIERQVDRMNGLVNDLLSVSRAGRGNLQLDRRTFDLASLVREVVQRYAAATGEEGRHHLTLDAPESLTVSGDQARIYQLLMNLVRNAVKYSPHGGDIAVSVRKDGVAKVEIAVVDHGIGIPPEELAQLGQPFVRGAGRAASFAGMGIGLYVAKLVAEGHGGVLLLESEGDEKGTTARVTLPL